MYHYLFLRLFVKTVKVKKCPLSNVEGMKYFLQGFGNFSFKIVRLMVICNGLKWTIYASGGLEPL